MNKSFVRVFSTLKIRSTAERILRLKDLSELKSDFPPPVRILGNGSNILMDDLGLKGTLVIVRDFPPKEPVLLREKKDSVELKVSAGMFLPTLARWAAKRSLTGCEYMIGIPGTVGGAVLQNAGANGQEIKDILIAIETYDLKTGECSELSKEECQLSYRSSRLKGNPFKIVFSATLRLQKAPASFIEDNLEKNLRYRKEKTPYSKPSLGSIYTRLQTSNGWLYPGKLIEEAGLKGTRVGGAVVSPIHANYIVNDGGATFFDVMKLMEIIEKKVLAHSGHSLQREIVVWTDR